MRDDVGPGAGGHRAAGAEPNRPLGVAEALAMLDHALDALNGADVVSMPADLQAQVLRALERAGSRHTAARAKVLAAFSTRGGYEDDGQASARAWLRWQTRVTRAAAAATVAWARRLTAHPVIASALAAGELSESWARQICGWSDLLPAGRRGDADQILAAAARGGADLADLAGLAQQIYERVRQGQPDAGDDGFDERYLRLGITFRGAGHAEGDLTPGCAAALSAVLEALGKKAGPEDTRTAGQRRHDALEEACRRLIAGGMVPGRAGQPTQIQVHMTLSQLRSLAGGSAAEEAWASARASQPGWLTGPEAEAAACDATLVPVVTGHVDVSALDSLTEAFLAAGGWRAARPGSGPGSSPGSLTQDPSPPSPPPPSPPPPSSSPGASPLSPSPRGAHLLRRSLLRMAADALSGPGGLAARLRAGLDSPALASVSLPLDIGAATETIPAHLRRAAAVRHRCCAFPGCDQPASVCDMHHVIPRSRGGPTAAHNIVPVCTFHHLTVIHRWGWTLALNPDGTTTAMSPDGQRTVHSHSPPPRAA